MKIALSAGHYNTNLGSETERRFVGPVYVELVKILRCFGYDVLELTPIEKNIARNFPGTLAECARQVTVRFQQRWKADLFLEIHAESNNLGDAGRGPFVVYPDWQADAVNPNNRDRDLVMRDTLGPAIAKQIAKSFNIPIRGNGVMSEKQTAVGAAGNRLGIFAVTEPTKSVTKRAIIEIMRFNKDNDLQVMYRKNFTWVCASAIAVAIFNHFEDVKISIDHVDPIFHATYLMGGGVWIKNQLTPGLVVTPKFIWKNREVQLFERAGVWSIDGGVTCQWLLQSEYAEALNHFRTDPRKAMEEVGMPTE